MDPETNKSRRKRSITALDEDQNNSDYLARSEAGIILETAPSSYATKDNVETTTTTPTVFVNPNQSIWSSTSQIELNKLVKELFVDLQSENSDEVIETLQELRGYLSNNKDVVSYEDVSMLSNADLKMVQPFFDFGGYSLLLGAGTKWYNNVEVISELLSTLLFIITVSLRMRHKLNDVLLAMSLQLILLSMTNFLKDRAVLIGAIKVITKILQYVAPPKDTDFAKLLLETHRLIRYEMGGEDERTKDTKNNDKTTTIRSTKRTLLPYLVQTLEVNFPYDNEVQMYIGQVLKIIIANGDTYQLPDICAQHMIKIGIPSVLLQMINIKSKSSTSLQAQDYALRALPSLLKKYRCYLEEQKQQERQEQQKQNQSNQKRCKTSKDDSEDDSSEEDSSDDSSSGDSNSTDST